MCFANFFAGIVQDQIIVELDIRNKTFTWQLLKLLLHYLIICTCSRDDRNCKQLILIDTFDSLVDTVRFSGQTKKIFLDSCSILQHMSSAIIETVFYNQMVWKSLIYSWVADFVRRRFHSISPLYTKPVECISKIQSHWTKSSKIVNPQDWVAFQIMSNLFKT